MKHLPIFVDLKDQPVLVVGGGDVAYRKVQSLLKVQAHITVIAESFSPGFETLNNSNLTLVETSYHEEFLEHKWLVIAATDNNEVNQSIYEDATSRRILINVVDSPKLCRFIFPSIVDRSPLVIAISSGGAAPVLARIWREKLESQIPQWTGKLVSIAAKYREKTQQKIKNLQQRRYVWERVFRGQANQLAAQEKWQEVEKTIVNEINREQETVKPKGFIHYVGTGPDDPEQLTLKALQLMQMADCIIYDETLHEGILNLCRKDAEFFAFDDSDRKTQFKNEELAHRLITEYEQGKIICRLSKNAPDKEHFSLVEFTALQNAAANFHIVSGVSA